jgi:hypothetical protein
VGVTAGSRGATERKGLRQETTTIIINNSNNNNNNNNSAGNMTHYPQCLGLPINSNDVLITVVHIII